MGMEPMNRDRRPRARRARVVGAVAAGVLLLSGAAGCAGDDSAEEAVVAGDSDTAMVALCDEMVSTSMSPDEATALAEAEGYTARVGSIDGQLQPTTRDFRPDRFTFEVVDGAVVSCQYG